MRACARARDADTLSPAMAATTVIELSIEADLCGPISMGTVAIIRAISG